MVHVNRSSLAKPRHDYSNDRFPRD